METTVTALSIVNEAVSGFGALAPWGLIALGMATIAFWRVVYKAKSIGFRAARG